jgi:hypothetical protein
VILTIFDAELGSPSFREPIASCLAFQRDQPCLKRISITLDIVKNLRRGWTVTIQYLDSNGSKQ